MSCGLDYVFADAGDGPARVRHALDWVRGGRAVPGSSEMAYPRLIGCTRCIWGPLPSSCPLSCSWSDQGRADRAPISKHKAEEGQLARMSGCVRGLLGSASLAALLALLIGLGIWQLQRLEWKQGLIAQIEGRRTPPPVTLKEARDAARGGEVRLSADARPGALRPGKERSLCSIFEGARVACRSRRSRRGRRNGTGRSRLRPGHAEGSACASKASQGERRDRMAAPPRSPR